jgi:hypothetical protein
MRPIARPIATQLSGSSLQVKQLTAQISVTTFAHTRCAR